jgi:multidrug resistance efflux pump
MSEYQFTALQKVEPKPIIKKIWRYSFFILLILFSILFLPWQQTIKGIGNVVAFDPEERDYKILSPVEGFIEKFYVKENQFVKKGDPLFKMVDLDSNYLSRLENIKEDFLMQIENTKLEIENIKKQILEKNSYLKSGIEIYEQKIGQKSEKLESIQIEINSLENALQVKKSNFERVQTLYNEGIESKREFEVVENLYIKTDADLKKAKIDLSIEKRDIEILKRERDKFINETKNSLYQLNTLNLNANNRQNQLSQQLENNLITIERYKNSEIVASKDGFVMRIYKNDLNRYLKKGEEILHFVPEVSKKAIFIKVSNFNMPLLKEGLQTRIMFYGWPTLQISGWPKIAFGSFGGVVEKVEPLSFDNGDYYAYVVEDSKEKWPTGNDLRVGTKATVWVRLSTVPIWYQLWRYINAIPPKMVNGDEVKR